MNINKFIKDESYDIRKFNMIGKYNNRYKIGGLWINHSGELMCYSFITNGNNITISGLMSISDTRKQVLGNSKFRHDFCSYKRNLMFYDYIDDEFVARCIR